MTTQIYIPYAVLLFAILLGWRSTLKFSLIAVGVASAAGLAVGTLQPIAIVSITCLFILAWLSNNAEIQRAGRWVSRFIFLALAVAMSNHLAPGFKNVLVYDRVVFSPDSIPFTMYLNFDKTLVGVAIYLFFLKPRSTLFFTRLNLRSTFATLSVLVGLLLPLALMVEYVRFDFKFPPLAWLWCLNNLFFVCLAEEALFRGFIQGSIERALPKKTICTAVSVVVAAFAFGLAHYKGGFAYIALATVAGLFYGYAYAKSARLESAMLVHFGLNLIHFAAFSYPALSRVP